MTQWVSYIQNGKTFYNTYVGMSQNAITSMLTTIGATGIQFLTQTAYNAGVAAQTGGI